MTLRPASTTLRYNVVAGTTTRAAAHAAGVTPPQALVLALHAGYSGSTPIAVGSRRSLRRCLRSLHEHGVRNCGPCPYQPAAGPAVRTG